MTRNTILMRVPIKFHSTVKDISEKEGVSMTNFLKEDGVSILESAKALDKLTGGIFRRKRRK